MIDRQAIYDIAKQVKDCDPDFILWVAELLSLSKKNAMPTLTEKPSEYWSEKVEHLKESIETAKIFYPPDHIFIRHGEELIKICQSNEKNNIRIWETENGRLFEKALTPKQGGQSESYLNLMILLLYEHFKERTGGDPNWEVIADILNLIKIKKDVLYDALNVASRWNTRLRKWKKELPKGSPELPPDQYYLQWYKAYEKSKGF